MWTTGASYDGAWKNGKRHGKATYTTATGDKFAGNYTEDKRDGEFDCVIRGRRARYLY